VEEDRVKIFDNKVLRIMFVLKRDEMVVGWRNCITRSFVSCTDAIRKIKSRT
jgi:hypothetical protein